MTEPKVGDMEKVVPVESVADEAQPPLVSSPHLKVDFHTHLLPRTVSSLEKFVCGI